LPTKYALDTNLFIDALRNAGDEARLQAFHERYAPAEFLSAIVALELCAGARAVSDAAKVQRHLLAPFERRGRVFAPSYPTWKIAGAAVAKLRGAQLTRAFYNDILLAASCREHGVTLVTRNAADFERIRRVLRFDFLPDWPAL
jgi:predicted nucleic acid-binding protein